MIEYCSALDNKEAISQLLNENSQKARLTNQLTLNAVAFTEVTVTSLGAISGTAFNVMKSLVDELGSLLPTAFSAMSRSWYVV